MKNDVGPIKIHRVVSKISQVTFSPLVALFLLTKNKNTNYVLISLDIGEKKVCIPTDFGVGISNIKSHFWKNHKKALKN